MQLGNYAEMVLFVANNQPSYQPTIVTGEAWQFAAVVKNGAASATVQVVDSLGSLPYASSVPVWADAWRSLHTTFVFVYADQSQAPSLHWNAVTFRRSQMNRFSAMQHGFARPDLISTLPLLTDPVYFAVFRDDPMEGYFVAAELELSDLAELLDDMKDWHGWPLRIDARGEPGPLQRFTLIGARYPNERPIGRVVRILNPGEPSASDGGGSIKPSAAVDPSLVQLLRHQGDEPISPSASTPEAKPDDSQLTVFDPSKAGPLHRIPGSQFWPVDKLCVGWMKQFGFRAMQLAITYQGRLVHAPAFTWAEPGYPITTPTMRMRLASVSKVITALGVLRMWEMLGRPLLDLFRTDPQGNVAALLGYPNPTDSRFKSRSVAHLLTHTAKLGTDNALGALVPNAVLVANWLAAHAQDKKAPWPLEGRDYVEFAMRHPGLPSSGWFRQASAPTLPTSSVADYSGLGMVLAAHLIPTLFHTSETYDQVMQTRPRFFFDRLGITRAQRSRTSSLEAPLDDSEVRYHFATPWLASSMRREDVTIMKQPPWGAEQVVGGPPSPTTYEPKVVGWGIANGDWSMAACDVARVVSSFDISPGTTGSLFDSPYTAAYALNHWAGNNPAGVFRSMALFDVQDASNSFWVQAHNGGNPGTGALVWRRDPIVVAMLLNTDALNWALTGGDPNVFTQVHAVLDLFSPSLWPSHDLFPAVGIVPPELS